MPSPHASAPLSDVLRRNLIFVSGKGGVGKTAVSKAIALAHSRSGRRVLWITFEDPTVPNGIKKISSTLWHLNCDSTEAFEEYAAMKLGVPKLAHIFLNNKLTKYLAKAAPGIHELVLLGKVWHERVNYDHVVIDMPSTGYGLAMFQSTANFATLFKGGPIHRDAEDMLATFSDPSQSGSLIIALPEEMPLREALELDEFLKPHFPKNTNAFLANRRFPGKAPQSRQAALQDQSAKLVRSAREYVENRVALEEHNLRIWRDARVDFGELEYLPPGTGQLDEALAEALKKRAYL